MHPKLRAAEGWIDLGNYDEAAEELHNCPPAIKSSIGWVKLWVTIYVATQRWVEVEMMTETLVKHAPDDPFTLTHRAEAFFRQGRAQDAFQVFRNAPDEFKKGPEYFYNLARYLCALEQFTLALSCIGKAVDADERIRMKALTDPDLERVWLDLQEG